MNYQRSKGLFDQKIDSQQALDQARATFEAQQAHVESLRKQVEVQRAGGRPRPLERRSDHGAAKPTASHGAAEGSSGRADVKSSRFAWTIRRFAPPFPGVISVLAARQGEVVNIGQPIVSIVNPDDLWVRADVPETYLDRVRLGDRMQVRFPDGMERQGTVFYRGVDADYATQRDVSQSKRDIKTFELRLRVDNSDRRLWPGLTAYVTLPMQDVH